MVDVVAEVWTLLLEVPEYRETALVHLERLYRAASQWSPLAELLHVHAQRLIDAAAIYESKLGDVESATAVYESALEHAEYREVAADALERLYTHGLLWAPLTGLLKRRAQWGSPHERQLILRRVAHIGATNLDEADRAFDDYSKPLLSPATTPGPRARSIGCTM